MLACHQTFGNTDCLLLGLGQSSGQACLVLLAPSLLVVVEDVVADVVFRLADKQPRSFPDAVASPTGGHGHSQQQQHCEEERHASVRMKFHTGGMFNGPNWAISNQTGMGMVTNALGEGEGNSFVFSSDLVHFFY